MLAGLTEADLTDLTIGDGTVIDGTAIIITATGTVIVEPGGDDGGDVCGPCALARWQHALDVAVTTYPDLCAWPPRCSLAPPRPARTQPTDAAPPPSSIRPPSGCRCWPALPHGASARPA